MVGGLTPDYWVNVYNAFITSPALAAKVNSISGNGKKYLAAHSLGNMVASSAIVDHGMNVERYFMINAAVPRESYDPSARVLDGPKMTPVAWRSPSNIPLDAFAAFYGELFNGNPADNRRFMTWKGRFAAIPKEKVFNFFSSGENTLEPNRDGEEPTFVEDVILHRRRVWIGGEMRKGTLTKAVGQAFSGQPWNSGWKSKRGGWSFNRDLWPAPGYPLTDALKIVNPLFKPFNDAPNGQSVHDAQGSTLLVDPHTAGKPGYQYLAALLAQDVPAMSWPAGSSPVGVFQGQQSDLQDLTDNGWDPSRDTFEETNTYVDGVDPSQRRWYHSDMKDVSYYYNHRFFENLVLKGSLNK